MKLHTVESLLKKYHEMTPKDIWWELAINEPDLEIIRKWQTTFYQMMNQIKLLVKENKIMLCSDGTYIWISAEGNKKLQKMLDEAVEL